MVACGPGKDRPVDANTADACQGFGCLVVNCEAKHMPPTTISGTVYAPNGTLALYNATVYVPSSDPGPLDDTLQCGQCSDFLPGGPVAKSTSDEAGHFQLSNVPVGNDIPFIVQIGKWRRQVLLENIMPCQDNPLPADKTRLPRNKTEGDLPKIAVTTGSCDALECLIRRLGVSDSEFTSDSGTGRIHLYNGNGADSASNGTLSPATALWDDVNKLKNYDIVMMSCECSQDPTTKPQMAMDAVKQYADLGGRIFTSHYHNIWIGGEYGMPTHAPAVWKDIATWTDGFADPNTDTIDQNPMHNQHGPQFATWMQNVGGSTTLGAVPIESGTGRQTAVTIDSTKAERWVYYDDGSTQYPQDFQFTTPNEAPLDQRCGKVVFSDMHVASDSFSSGTFPSGCATSDLTPQEKALAFMFFDIATCVNVVQ